MYFNISIERGFNIECGFNWDQMNEFRKSTSLNFCSGLCFLSAIAWQQKQYVMGLDEVIMSSAAAPNTQHRHYLVLEIRVPYDMLKSIMKFVTRIRTI